MFLNKLLRILLSFSLIAAFNVGARAQEKLYSRQWLQMPVDERTEFLAGYIDCSHYEAGETFWSSVSWDVLQTQMGEYYSSNGVSDIPFRELVERLAKEQKPGLATGEHHPEKHGIFDGQYWREATINGRIGFVEGYQECQMTKLPAPRHYRFQPLEQVRDIDGWYGLSSKNPSAVNVHRLSAKIADVLALFEK